MAFCTSCGAAGVASEQFCRSCGTALSTSQTTAGMPPPMAPPPSMPMGVAPGAHMSQFGPLANWGPRALGFLVDIAIVLLADIVFIILGAIVHPLVFFTYLIGLGGFVFMAWQLGETGQTPGMRLVGLKCIHNQTGQVLGFGMGVVRGLADIINSIICYVGWFFPLWDTQRQTVADKIMSTYVIRVPKQGFSLLPPS
jgi:uncharacterized RDD family membrane protein YckC